jgi:hypothetical protein
MVNMSKFKKLKNAYRKNGTSGVIKLVNNKIRGKSNNQIIDITDEYIKWLRFANAGMLQRGNYWCFDYALKNIPNDVPILEIGSFCGLSTNILYHYKRTNNKNNKLFTCDKWFFEGVSGDDTLPICDIKYSEYREFVKATFISNTRMFSKNDLPHTIEMMSDDFFEAWEHSQKVVDVFDQEVTLGGNLGFCFVDGNHSYEGIKKDFLNTDNHLMDGGFILFDDSASNRTNNMGAQKVIQEIIDCGRYKLVRENPNFFFRKFRSL